VSTSSRIHPGDGSWRKKGSPLSQEWKRNGGMGAAIEEEIDRYRGRRRPRKRGGAPRGKGGPVALLERSPVQFQWGRRKTSVNLRKGIETVEGGRGGGASLATQG